MRRLVPAPIRRADLALFRAVATAEIPLVSRILPSLSRAANHSRLWMVIAAVLASQGGRFGRRAAVRGMLAIGATSTLTNLPAKLLTGRRRPDLEIVPEIRRLARIPSSTSFPSGHSASAFAFATAVLLEHRRLRLPLLGLAGAVAASRVYTGVHYPGDVIAGSAIGVGMARATTRFWPLLDRRPAESNAAPTVPIEPDGGGVTVVANAGAGNVLEAGPAEHLRRWLPGIRLVDVEAGEELEQALERAATEARVLGIAGGDGSANLAATVAERHQLPLAVVAAGTFNHLAIDLGVEELSEVVRAVVERRAVHMDLGAVGSRRFVNATSIGAYPRFVDGRVPLEHRLGKWPAALWSLARILFTGTPTELRLDGRARRVWNVFVGNGRFTSDGFAPSRRRRLDEGVLDVRVVSAERPFSRLRFAAATLAGRPARSLVYEAWTTDTLHVHSPHGPLKVAVDGEIWQAPDDFAITTRPQALVVMQPTPRR